MKFWNRPYTYIFYKGIITEMCSLKPKLRCTDAHIWKLQLIHLQLNGFLRPKTKVSKFKERIQEGEVSRDSTLLALRNASFITVLAC